MSEDGRKGTVELGGGTYGMIGIGVGLAASHIGSSIFMSIIWGIFWPVPLGFWLIKALHSVAV